MTNWPCDHRELLRAAVSHFSLRKKKSRSRRWHSFCRDRHATGRRLFRPPQKGRTKLTHCYCNCTVIP